MRESPLVLIAAWKQPERMEALLALSDPALREARRQQAAELEGIPPEQIRERLEAISSTGQERLTERAAARYGPQWEQLSPRFRDFIARTWSGHERADTARTGDGESTNPETGSG